MIQEGHFGERDQLYIKKNRFAVIARLREAASPDILDEAVLYTYDWSYLLRGIEMRVGVWHGTEDHLAPYPVGKNLTRALRNAGTECTLHRCRRGHLDILEDGHHILNFLVPDKVEKAETEYEGTEEDPNISELA